MAERELDDLMPSLGVSRALSARPTGLGSLKHMVRLTLAVTVSWIVATRISGSTMALFAPVTTLLVVQSSPWTTLGISIQRIVGTGLGVAAASVWVNLVGQSWWSFLVAIAASILIARVLPLSIGGQLQIPVAVIFVMALGPGSLSQDLWRVLDVLIGGVIGLVAVFIAPSRPRTEPLDAALAGYRDALVAVLREVGRESGSHAAPLPEESPHGYVATSRALRRRSDDCRERLVSLVEGIHLNLRARHLREVIGERALLLRRLTGIALNIRGAAGSANHLYDRAGTDPALPATDLRGLVDAVADQMEAVLGPGGAPLGTRDRAQAVAAGRALESRLRAAADDLVAAHGHVGGVLESVTMIGRLDRIRAQLAEVLDDGGPEPDGMDDDVDVDIDARRPGED